MKKLLILLLIIINAFVGFNANAAAIELYSTPLFSDANLQAYYRLNGNSNDEKGYANGTDTNVSYAAAVFSNGASVSGTGYSDFGNNFGFNSTDPRSVSFWMKTSATANQMVFGKTSTLNHTAAGWTVMIYDPGGSKGAVYLQINSGASAGANELQTSNYKSSDSTQRINDNNWHHIVITYDGSKAASGVKIYRDSVNQTLSTDFDSLTGSSTNAVNARFGANSAGGSNFVGMIDDLAVFNDVLTPTEVSNLYNGTWPAATPSAPPGIIDFQ